MHITKPFIKYIGNDWRGIALAMFTFSTLVAWYITFELPPAKPRCPRGGGTIYSLRVKIWHRLRDRIISQVHAYQTNQYVSTEDKISFFKVSVSVDNGNG